MQPAKPLIKLHAIPRSDQENWRPVVGSGRFLVSDTGRVFDSTKKRIVPESTNNRGYRSLWISGSGRKSATCSVHRLVCEAFVGPAPGERSQVNHKNGIKDDNRAANLEWASCAENMKHAHDAGLYPDGERHYKAVIKQSDIPAIMDQRQSGMTFAEIAERYGVGAGCIHKIVKGHNRSREIKKYEHGFIWEPNTARAGETVCFHSILCTYPEFIAVCEFLAERRIGGITAPAVSGNKAKRH